MDITIRRMETMDDFNKMYELDLNVWGGDPVPTHQTITVAKNGGIILGAFLKEKLVGFLYSFPGIKDGEVYVCSHLMGIDPHFRNQGLGYRLKQRQAEEAKLQGMKKIRWTFDPLQSRNAYLNIAKLGSICSDYLVNCYGDLTDNINKNMPSDRLHVEWLVDSPYLKNRIALFKNVEVDKKSTLIEWDLTGSFPEPIGLNRQIDWNAPFLFVPIPVEIESMIKTNPQLALDWRFVVRDSFQTLFSKGWIIGHVIRRPHESVQYYVLIEGNQLEL